MRSGLPPTLPGLLSLASMASSVYSYVGGRMGVEVERADAAATAAVRLPVSRLPGRGCQGHVSRCMRKPRGLEGPTWQRPGPGSPGGQSFLWPWSRGLRCRCCFFRPPSSGASPKPDGHRHVGTDSTGPRLARVSDGAHGRPAPDRSCPVKRASIDTQTRK